MTNVWDTKGPSEKQAYASGVSSRDAEVEALRKELSAARKWNQDLLDAARETRPDDDRRAAEWGLAVFAALKKTEAEFAEARANWKVSFIDGLQRELAEAKAVIANLDERLAQYEAALKHESDCVEAAKARIAELEKERDADLWFDQLKKEVAISSMLRTRAERAETECMAIREALQWIETKAQLAHNVNHVEVYAIHRGIADKARAALNPSPAARDHSQCGKG